MGERGKESSREVEKERGRLRIVNLREGGMGVRQKGESVRMRRGRGLKE